MSWKRSSVLAILLIVSSTGHSRSIADGFGSSSDAFSSSQPRKTLDQEIGSPSELAWQAWLLVENKSGGQSALDSSNILRRITPKSIFIAPELVACPSGYSSDGKGVCKPDPIKIDEDAQRQFFLKRLNALYGKFGNNRKKPEAQGPLQINIPISLAPKPEPQPELQPELQPESQSEAEPQKPIATENRLNLPLAQENVQEPGAGLAYSVVANDTKKPGEDEPSGTTTFFLGNSNSSDPKKDAAQPGQVVQVAEIVDDVNETFSGVVDYKIPVINLNRSDDQTRTTSDAGPIDRTESKGQDPAEDSSPTVVLLLSPTRQPVTRSTTEKQAEETDVTDEDATVQTTEDDYRQTDATIQTVSPLDLSSASTPRSTSTESSYTRDDETVYTDEESQTQDSEDHEADYEDTAADDEFAEDELLKPGEAGMTIPSKNRDLLRPKAQLSTLPDEPASTTLVDSTTVAIVSTDPLDSTFKAGLTDELPTTTTLQTTDIPSTIVTSTELAPKETTFYVTAPLGTKTTLPTVAPMTTSDDDRLDEQHELVTEPEVVFSTQQNSYGRKRPMHPIRVAESPSYTSALYDEPVTRQELDFQRRQKPSITVNDEPILFKSDARDIPSDFKDQMASATRTRLGGDEPSYVRFPEQPTSEQFGYVRFPSDDVNSIHSPDGYKEHSPYRSRDDSATSTKSSVPARQKSPPANWRLPPAARMDRQQQQQQQQQQQRQQKQKPMLLRFWARMPLVRDLSFYPTTSHGSHNEPIGGAAGGESARQNSRFSTAQPRRAGHYRETTSRDVNRLQLAVNG